MNENQNKYYRMFVTTQTTLDENTDIWSSNVKFAENKTVLDNEIADGPVTSQGIETNIKLGFRDFKLFANYALINTRLKYDDLNEQKPLTPKHTIGSVLMYEVEDKWRIGYEAYYTGRQFRSNRTPTDDYWVTGFIVMREIKKLSVYINFENFIDTRQHRLEKFQANRHFKPDLPEIWAPTDGRIINVGLILDL